MRDGTCAHGKECLRPCYGPLFLSRAKRAPPKAAPKAAKAKAAKAARASRAQEKGDHNMGAGVSVNGITLIRAHCARHARPPEVPEKRSSRARSVRKHLAR